MPTRSPADGGTTHPGLCIAARRCTGYRLRRQPAPADRHGLCGPCEQRTYAAIRSLPGDWAALEPLIWDRPNRPGGGHAPLGPRLPINTHADWLACGIAYTAVTWEIPVRAVADLSDPPHQQAQPTWRDLTRAVATLTAHFPVLLSLPATDHIDYDRHPATLTGPQAALDLAHWHERAKATIGTARLVLSVPGQCSTCMATALRRADGSDTVYCDLCDTRWTWDDYRRYIGMELAALGAQ